MNKIDRRNMILGSAAGAGALIATTAKASESTGWQPIESAPKDGTKVMLYIRYPGPYKKGEYCICPGYWIDEESYTPAGGRYYLYGKLVNEAKSERSSKSQRWIARDFYDGTANEPQPTHWMPIPDPPEVA